MSDAEAIAIAEFMKNVDEVILFMFNNLNRITLNVLKFVMLENTFIVNPLLKLSAIELFGDTTNVADGNFARLELVKELYSSSIEILGLINQDRAQDRARAQANTMSFDFHPNRVISFRSTKIPVWVIPLISNDFELFMFMLEKEANIRIKNTHGKYFIYSFWRDKKIQDVRFYQKFAFLGFNINQYPIHLSEIHLNPFETWFSTEDHISNDYIVRNGELQVPPPVVDKIEKFFHDIEALLNIGYDPKFITSNDPIFKIFLDQNIDNLTSLQSISLRTIYSNNVNIQCIPESIRKNHIKLDFKSFRLNIGEQFLQSKV